MAKLNRAGNSRYCLVGEVDKDSVPALLESGWKVLESQAQRGGTVTVDLAGVISADSAALALLLEWTRRSAGLSRGLYYENFPGDLAALAGVCGVSELYPGLVGAC